MTEQRLASAAGVREASLVGRQNHTRPISTRFRRRVPRLSPERRELRRFALLFILLVLVLPSVLHAASGRVDTLNRRLEHEVRTLNPILATTNPEIQVLSYLFDPLVAYDQNLRIIPALATRWEISSDGTRFTFHLHPRATFSDGRPITARDVIFTLDLIRERSPQYAGRFARLDPKVTRAIDARTVQVGFTPGAFVSLGTFVLPILPAHSSGVDDGAASTPLVGSGPYALAPRDAVGRIVLRRRDAYHGPKPAIQMITFAVLSNETVAWHALTRGEIDEMRLSTDQWLRARDDPAVRKGLTLVLVPDLGYNCIAWNMRDPLLRDVRVRRALSMAYDRDSIIRHLYAGTASPITGPLLPAQPEYSHDVPTVPYDLRGARRLLTEAGWRDSDGDLLLDQGGVPFRLELLLTSSSKASAEQGQVYQAALRTLGVELVLTRLDGASFLDRVGKGTFQGAFLRWGLDPIPDLDNFFHSSQVPPIGQNIGFYTNGAVDRVLETLRTERDPAKRRRLFQDLHARLATDQPYTWTMQVTAKWAMSPRVLGVAVSPVLGLFDWLPGPRAWRVKGPGR